MTIIILHPPQCGGNSRAGGEAAGMRRDCALAGRAYTDGKIDFLHVVAKEVGQSLAPDSTKSPYSQNQQGKPSVFSDISAPHASDTRASAGAKINLLDAHRATKVIPMNFSKWPVNWTAVLTAVLVELIRLAF